MIHVSRTITVPVPRDEAFRLTARFGRASEWDPGLVSSSQETPGEPSPGTRFAVVARFNGNEVPMTYEMTGFDAPSRMVISGTGTKGGTVDTITFADAPGGGTTITYEAVLTMDGLLRFAEPFIRKTFNRTADEAVAGLASWLAREAGTG